MRTAAIIPAHNEAESIPAVVADLRATMPELDIVVVDDGSQDNTSDVLEQLRVDRLRFHFCLGIGTAIRAGIRRAAERGAEVVVRLDADGQHAARHVPALLEPILSGRADAVQGSRYRNAQPHHTPFRRRALQWILSKCLSAVARRRITDPTSGFWAFGPRAVQLLSRRHPTGYPEPELLLLLVRNGLRVDEVSVPMEKRAAGRSTLTLPRIALTLARVLLAVIVVPLRPADKGGLDE